ncbi:MAG: hypothetical protein EXQ86_05575 [Rhodospirillales bacterium]|nr:hypothetical protein [Rhodospirillales bacterium]
MDWAVIAIGVLVIVAGMYVRRRYGLVGKSAGAALGRLLGERGTRYALTGLYVGTLLLWLAIFLWVGEERSSWEGLKNIFKAQAPKP